MTDISLREYIDLQIRSLSKRTDARFQAQEAAIVEAKQQLQHRLEGMNEFRSAMEDQSKSFITRHELDLRADEIQRRLLMLEESMNQSRGRSAITTVLWSVAASTLVAILAGIVVIMWSS